MSWSSVYEFIVRYHPLRFLIALIIGVATGAVFVGITCVLIKIFRWVV